jgi:uncharacterized membrane protein YeaQ/YmgE (transglycosylase-associated protein family)
MVGEIIGAIFLGIIAGYLGRALMPGKQSMGFIATIGLGLVGSRVGWAVFTWLLGIGDDDKFDLGGWLGAIVGVIIVLAIWGAVAGRNDKRAAPTV